MHDDVARIGESQLRSGPRIRPYPDFHTSTGANLMDQIITTDRGEATPSDFTVACPRCGGSGRVRFIRKGGWITEECVACSGTGEIDPATADTVRRLVEAGEEAQEDGPVDMPVPEDVAFDPSDEDLA